MNKIIVKNAISFSDEMGVCKGVARENLGGGAEITEFESNGEVFQGVKGQGRLSILYILNHFLPTFVILKHFSLFFSSKSSPALTHLGISTDLSIL